MIRENEEGREGGREEKKEKFIIWVPAVEEVQCLGYIHSVQVVTIILSNTTTGFLTNDCVFGEEGGNGL